MTKFIRYERIFTWTMIAIALLWLAVIAIPPFVDRISRHEDAWAGRHSGVVTQDMPSTKVSDAD